MTVPPVCCRCRLVAGAVLIRAGSFRHDRSVARRAVWRDGHVGGLPRHDGAKVCVCVCVRSRRRNGKRASVLYRKNKSKTDERERWHSRSRERILNRSRVQLEFTGYHIDRECSLFCGGRPRGVNNHAASVGMVEDNSQCSYHVARAIALSEGKIPKVVGRKQSSPPPSSSV